MILRLAPGTPEDVIHELRQRCAAEGLRPIGGARGVIAIAPPVPAALTAEFAASPHVIEAVTPDGGLLLVHRAYREEPSVVRVGATPVGGGSIAIIAGPCSVEGRVAMLEIAHQVRQAGAHILRGGAFKPRTSPYAFQGFGSEGLSQLKAAGEAVGLPVISEIMDAADVPTFVDHDIDCLQIGARNMQNFTLLRAVAKAGKPVMLKRGMAATIAEWLAAAEHLAAAGCLEIILCERGIRTFERATRNTLDLTVLPLMRELTHLPIIVDPSHAAGIARIIPPLARASIVAGADGLALEVHPRPEHARSDGEQALLAGELTGIVADARVLACLDGRRLHDTGGKHVA